MAAKKTPDESFFDAQLDFILNSPQVQFDDYLTDSGIDSADFSCRAALAIDRALESHSKTKKAVEALAGLTPAQQKVIAKNLHIRRQVLTAFREHRVDVSTVPTRFMALLAREIGQAVEALTKALSGPAPRVLAGQYKADERPNFISTRTPFEQLLIEAAMSGDEIEKLIRDDE